jgi:hypothetical protein
LLLEELFFLEDVATLYLKMPEDNRDCKKLTGDADLYNLMKNT